jgi:hypothetical protein
MGPTEKYLRFIVTNNHPLATPIHEEEVPNLIIGLRERLQTSEIDFDGSPASLRKLENALVRFYLEIKEKKKTLPEDENLIWFIRELAAYIGNVLVINAGGHWDLETSINLYSTHVCIEGAWKVTKERKTSSSEKVYFIIGGKGAYVWDQIISGQKPGLIRFWNSVKRKQLRETL